MKNSKKTLVASLCVAGAMTIGAGAASAQYGGGDDDSQPTTEPTEQVDQETVVDDDGILQVQDTDGDETDGDDAEDGDVEGEDAEDGDSERRRGHNCNGRLDAASEIIGIPAEDIRAELDAGATLAEIAEANGVSADALVDGLVDNVEERLDAKVAEGRITEEEAAEKLENKTERIEDKVNGVDSDAGEDTDAST